MENQIHKLQFAQIVHDKLEGKVEPIHVSSILNIIFEEMVRDLFDKGKFWIGGFGRFIYTRLPPRRHFNFQTGKVEQAAGNKILQFKLTKALHRKLLNSIDVERTFSTIKEENDTNTKLY